MIVNDPELKLHDCWAKTFPNEHTSAHHPGLTVSDHCQIVGHVARSLIESLLPSTASLLPKGTTTTILAAHDIGKLTPGFQLKCPNWTFYDSVFTQTYHDKLEKNHASEALPSPNSNTNPKSRPAKPPPKELTSKATSPPPLATTIALSPAPIKQAGSFTTELD